jgi:hypothetical protein
VRTLIWTDLAGWAKARQKKAFTPVFAGYGAVPTIGAAVGTLRFAHPTADTSCVEP